MGSRPITSSHRTGRAMRGSRASAGSSFSCAVVRSHATVLNLAVQQARYLSPQEVPPLPLDARAAWGSEPVGSADGGHHLPTRSSGLLRTLCELAKPSDSGCAYQSVVVDELACRPGSVPGRLATTRSATIHLGRPLPAASGGLPASSGGPPSNARADAAGGGILLTLLRVGFTEPPRSPGTLVVSYTTLSPLPAPVRVPAVCFLWHCPAGHPGWVLPTTPPCGARTFLDARRRRGRPANSSAPEV